TWECVSAINQRAGCAREVTRRTAAAFHRSGHQSRHAPPGANHTPRLLRADAIDLCGGAIHGDARQRWRHDMERIARGVAVVIHEKANVITVVASEAPPPIVEAQPVLAAAGFGSQRHRAWIDHEIPPAQIDPRSFGMAK